MKPEQSPSFYKPNQTEAVAPAEAAESVEPASADNIHPTGGSFSWQATEFVELDRPAMWYPALLGLTVLLAGGVYLLTKDYFATGTIVALGIIIGVAAARKPRLIEFQISSGGIQIGSKQYSYAQFKSFGIIREGAEPTVELFPTKKLMPAISMHFNAQDEHQITAIVGQYLPYEERKMASIDRLAHRLHF